MNNKFNAANMNELIGIVSRKIGVPPEQLRAELESGNFDSAINSMKPNDAAVFNQMISNPQMLEKFMSTPQATALYKKLTEGK